MWMEGTRADRAVDVWRANIGADYFKTLGTPLLAGRSFNAGDTLSSPKVAIVNETFARKLAGGANPVGKKFTIESTPFDPETQVEIVGLVKDTKYVFLRETFQPIAFLAMSQTAQAELSGDVLIHSNLPLDRLTAEVKGTLQDISPSLRFSFKVLRTEIQESLLPERLMAALSSAFGLLAGLLAAVGLYGVIAYTMVQRRHEIGIRMALGAKARDILTMVLLESGEILAIGLGAGIVLSLAAGRMARSLLFGLSPSDPAAIMTAVGALALIALLATYLPARRAAALDPLKALREE
jgi:ABC-type antimicrobial peptide transport system permease subunit